MLSDVVSDLFTALEAEAELPLHGKDKSVHVLLEGVFDVEVISSDLHVTEQAGLRSDIHSVSHVGRCLDARVTDVT